MMNRRQLLKSIASFIALLPFVKGYGEKEPVQENTVDVIIPVGDIGTKTIVYTSDGGITTVARLETINTSREEGEVNFTASTSFVSSIDGGIVINWDYPDET